MLEKKTIHLYNLPLGKSISIRRWLHATRIPGGWIFNNYKINYKRDNFVESNFLSSVFVPYNNEFKAEPCESCEQTGYSRDTLNAQTGHPIECQSCHATGFIYSNKLPL